LPQTKSAKARMLPMPKEVGAAIADYVLHGRPMVDVPEVFVRHKAPRGAFTSPCGINAIVREHLLRTGIAAPSKGAHMLRHSMATRLVNAGVPIKTIADVLGHTSIDTTAIYTKVDVTRLAMAALPFPTGGAR
jgi:integrase/recombinase XerD